jgi:hypothetical protein
MMQETQIKKKTLQGWWFWGIIILGILLPFIVESIVELIFDFKNFFNTLLPLLASFILMGLLNSIPFVILAFIVRSLWYRPETERLKDYFKHKSGVIGAGILSIGSNLCVNIAVWVGSALNLAGSSTSVIVYVFLPIYGTITILIGYAVGRLIGKIILHYKNKHL